MPDTSQGLKKIEAIIKPFKLDEVKEALYDIGLQGITAIEAKGYGRQKGHTEIYREVPYTVEFLPKVKIELVLPAKLLTKALEAIGKSAKTGRIGDGRIFVSNIDHAVRIRTGETGEDAVTFTQEVFQTTSAPLKQAGISLPKPSTTASPKRSAKDKPRTKRTPRPS